MECVPGHRNGSVEGYHRNGLVGDSSEPERGESDAGCIRLGDAEQSKSGGSSAPARASAQDSRSLGKYYNGTPLQVLSRGDEWTQVRIGQQVGYMMTKYLLFSDRINTQLSALTMKTNVNPTTEILWDDTAVPENITDYEVQGLLIVGVIGDKWYLVWNPDTDRYGRIWQTELWDGNG